MEKIIKHILLAVSMAVVVSACTDSKKYETSYCALMDISGTYAGEKTSVVNIIKAGIVYPAPTRVRKHLWSISSRPA